MENAYKILGLQPGASKKEIRTAYRTLAKKYHPDKHQQKQEYAAIFQKIQGAYAYLMEAKTPEVSTKTDTRKKKQTTNWSEVFAQQYLYRQQAATERKHQRLSWWISLGFVLALFLLVSALYFLV